MKIDTILKDNHLPSLMDQTFDQSYQRIEDIVDGLRQYRVLLWAVQSGIADVLTDEGPMESDLLIQKLGYHPEPAHLWIEALVESKILERSEKTVWLSQGISRYLISNSPLYQGDTIKYISEAIWGNEADFFSVGIKHDISEDKINPDFLRVLSQRSMRGELQDVSRVLSQKKEFLNARRLLDIGGGHGMYSISFCQQNPNLSGVILDRPSIIQFTQAMINHYMMADRISVVSGDMNTDLPGCGYDLVFASHIIYGMKDPASFINRIYQKINIGGIFISNHKFDDDWVLSDTNLLSALETATRRMYHQMIPENEYNTLIQSTGFVIKDVIKIKANTGYTTLHIAAKVTNS
ncbi:class I SAM-dependent methyltransferase [Methanospirillum lacunae]|nr:methyltransferase [Methanospirillum lacunae]